VLEVTGDEVTGTFGPADILGVLPKVLFASQVVRNFRSKFGVTA